MLATWISIRGRRPYIPYMVDALNQDMMWQLHTGIYKATFIILIRTMLALVSGNIMRFLLKVPLIDTENRL